MNWVDANCLLGHWPFRKIRKNTFSDLKEVHRKNGISYSLVASLNSIFYNDPFEGDLELSEIIKNTGYRQLLTINPTLPGIEKDIEAGVVLFNVAGVRIYPGFHGYRLTDECVAQLASILKQYRLPLFITVRMDDERLVHLFRPETVKPEDIRAFAEANPDLPTVLLNIRSNEIYNIRDLICERKNLLVDTSGFKGELFIVERLLETINASAIVYGSLHPLYALRSTMLLVEKAEVDEETKEMILGKNICSLLKKCR